MLIDEKDEVRNWQLQFKTRLPLSLYTGQKLEGECRAPIVVVLVNANTGNIVESGPVSSVKLDFVVLEGGFKKEDDDNWTRVEFEKYVVKEREGKRPVLTGNLEVILKGGLQGSPGYCENIRICEAKMEAFTVKEQRGESYKKQYPPASDDAKLNETGIYKVEEFLRQLSMDSEKLRNYCGVCSLRILGRAKTKKKWKALLDHAKSCTLNGKFYVYYHDNENDQGVMFNNVGQLSGLTAGGLNYAAARFSPQQKVAVQNSAFFGIFHAICRGQPLTSDYQLNFYLHCQYSIGMIVNHRVVSKN
ncbi:hypothetical protein BT93_E2204 [Corymbia citriodora subsp. variegata]|nr:hypothetical protein BT93_E2204 [Corymbia citriodora subsp. variegata]